MQIKNPNSRIHSEDQPMENRHCAGWMSKIQRSIDQLTDDQHWTSPTSSNTEKKLILRKKATRDLVLGVTTLIMLLISVVVYIIYPEEKTKFLIFTLFLIVLVLSYIVEVYYMLTSKIPYVVRIGRGYSRYSVVFYEKKGVVFYFEIILILVFCSMMLAFVFWSVPLYYNI